MNFVELARQNYDRTSARVDCRHCRCAIHLRDGRWLDSGGHHWCPSGLLMHEPVAVQQPRITRSPLLRRML